MFDHKSVHVRFVVQKLALRKVFLPILRSPLSVSFHQCPELIFIYTMFLTERQRAKPGNLPNSNAVSELGDNLYEKKLLLAARELSLHRLQGRMAIRLACNVTEPFDSRRTEPPWHDMMTTACCVVYLSLCRQHLATDDGNLMGLYSVSLANSCTSEKTNIQLVEMVGGR